MTLRFQDSEKIREDRRRRRLIGVAAFLVIAYLTVMGRAVQLALQDNEKLEEIATRSSENWNKHIPVLTGA